LDKFVTYTNPRYGWIKDLRVIGLAVICVFMGFLVAALIFGKPWHLPPNWGDIPTWLATIAASVAGVVAYRVYRIEAQRDQMSDQERRSAQASKVAAWYGSQQRIEAQRDQMSDQERRSAQASKVPAWYGSQQRTVAEPIWGAFLRNASDLPVFSVWVTFHFVGPNDSIENWKIQTIKKLILPPGDAPIHLEIDENALREYFKNPKMYSSHRVEIEFTDVQGVRWHRDMRGGLQDITARTGAWPMLRRS
jgi:hypothetical protein